MSLLFLIPIQDNIVTKLVNAEARLPCGGPSKIRAHHSRWVWLVVQNSVPTTRIKTVVGICLSYSPKVPPFRGEKRAIDGRPRIFLRLEIWNIIILSIFTLLLSSTITTLKQSYNCWPKPKTIGNWISHLPLETEKEK